MRSGRAAASVLVVSVLLCGCVSSAQNDAQVRRPPGVDPEETSQGGMGDLSAGDPLSLGAGLFVLCVQGIDQGEIVSVEVPDEPSVVVNEFTVLNEHNDEAYMAIEETLEGQGYDTAQRTVTARCDTNDDPATLLVELERTVPDTVTVTEFNVTWEAGGNSGTIVFPFEVSLCKPGETEFEMC